MFLLDVQERILLVFPGLSPKTGKAIYFVNIDGDEVRFVGNPNWDEGGAFLIPSHIPEDVDVCFLEMIASKIEARVC